MEEAASRGGASVDGPEEMDLLANGENTHGGRAQAEGRGYPR